MDSTDDEKILCGSEILLSAKSDINSCTEILSSDNEIQISPTIPNPWVDSATESNVDSVTTLLKDDAESQQDILKNVNDQMESSPFENASVIVDESAGEKPMEMDSRLKAKVDNNSGDGNENATDCDVKDQMESSPFENASAIVDESAGDKPMDIDSRLKAKSDNSGDDNANPADCDTAKTDHESSNGEKMDMDETQMTEKIADTQESMLTSQDLLADSPPSGIPIVSIDDTLAKSPDMSFMTDSQTMKDSHDPFLNRDVTLHLSPSQLTQGDIVPETPTKSLVSDRELTGGVQISPYALDEGEIDSGKKKDSNLVVGGIDLMEIVDAVVRSKEEEKKASQPDLVCLDESIEDVKKTVETMPSVSTTITLNDSFDQPESQEAEKSETKSSTEQDVVSIVNTIVDATVEARQSEDYLKKCDTDIINVTVNKSDSDVSKSKSSDDSSLFSLPKRVKDFSSAQATSSSEVSGGSLNLSLISPDSIRARTPTIICSQEDRRSAEIALKNLREHSSSTPIESLGILNSMASDSSICVVNDITIISKRIGTVIECVEFEVQDGEIITANQYLHIMKSPFEKIGSEKAKPHVMVETGQFLVQFTVNTESNHVTSNPRYFVESVEKYPPCASISRSSSENMSYYFNASRVTNLILKNSIVADQECYYVEDITSNNDVGSDLPKIIWNDNNVEDIYFRASKSIARSKFRNGRRKITGLTYDEKWRFHIEHGKLVKVDRLFIQVNLNRSGEYAADMSSSLSSKYSIHSNLSEPLSQQKSSSLDLPIFSLPSRRKNISLSPKTSSSSDNTPKRVVSRPNNTRKTVAKSSKIADVEEMEEDNSDDDDSKFPPTISKPLGEIKIGTRVFARFQDTNYYLAKVLSKEDNDRFAVKFIEDRIIKQVKEKDIINTAWLPLRLSVMARSIDHIVAPGIINSYFKTKKDKGYTINRDDDLIANFSAIDVWLSSSQAKILEEDLYGNSRINQQISSPVAKGLNLGNIVQGKRKAAMSSSPSEIPKSRKKLEVPDSTPSSSSDELRKSKHKKNGLNSDSRSSSPAPKGVFNGLAFLLTNSGDKDGEESQNASDAMAYDKAELRSSILQEGGQLLSNFAEASKSDKKCYLLASSHLRTIKYIQCVAAGLRCLSHLFVLKSISKKKLLNVKDFILPAGFSLVNDAPVKWHGKKNVMNNKKIMLCGTQDFQTVWADILLSAGANVIKPAQKSIDMDDFVNINVVVSEPNCPENILNLAEMAEISVVTTEWIIQSIIMGRCLSFDLHHKFSITAAY